MSNPKKLLIAALAVIFLAGATPLAAQLPGTWQGTGTGSTQTPTERPFLIYPWQTWGGTLHGLEFTGMWVDQRGFHGCFRGETPPISPPEFAVYRGEWTWINDETGDTITMGTFEMTFFFLEDTCEGEWWRYCTPDHGTMTGHFKPVP